MATWKELCDYLDSQYKVNHLSEDTLSLGFRFDDDRSQMIFVEEKGPFALVRSPFAEVKDAKPEDLLEEPFIFGIQLVDDLYFVSQVLMLESLDSPEIDTAIEALAPLADELEKKYTGGKDVY